MHWSVHVQTLNAAFADSELLADASFSERSMSLSAFN